MHVIRWRQKRKTKNKCYVTPWTTGPEGLCARPQRRLFVACRHEPGQSALLRRGATLATTGRQTRAIQSS
jgi:hypothetical protein